MPDENRTERTSLEDLISAAELNPPERSNFNKSIDEQLAKPTQEPERSQSLVEALAAEPLRELPTLDASQCNHEGTFPHQRTFCRSCKALICPRCCSSLDSLYCVQCMSKVDVQSQSTEVTDDDGVIHRVNQINVTPAYNTIRWIPDNKTTAKALSDMDESELFEFIRAYKDAVREAERALDFRRIRLGSAQLELDERREQTRRKLRADKTKFPVKTVTLDKSGKKVTKTASTGTMLDMIKALQQLQALKKQQQAKPPETAMREGDRSQGGSRS